MNDMKDMNIEITKIVALNRTVACCTYKADTWYLWGDANITDIVNRMKSTITVTDEIVSKGKADEFIRTMAVNLAMQEYLSKNVAENAHNVPLYNIHLHDNPKSSFNFVIQFLNHVMGIDIERGEELAQQINDKGMVIIGPYTLEVAKTFTAYMAQVSDDSEVDQSLPITIVAVDTENIQSSMQKLEVLIKEKYPQDL